ncbi:MAG: hypothetical protein U1E26_03400 [Coriobacteriia bacterium]|nr:hypothetical protein [Coriobacteriia bacterium]
MILERLFGSRTRAGMIGLLLSEPECAFGIREIARLLSVSPNSARVEADNLVELGIVTDRRVGTSRLCQANPMHPLYPELRTMALKTRGIAATLRDALSEVRGISAAFIFGSVAANRDDEMSDVDLMVIGATRPRDVYAALRVAQDTSKRTVSASVFTEREVADRLAAGDAFIASVLAGARIPVIGDLGGLGALRARRPDSAGDS